MSRVYRGFYFFNTRSGRPRPDAAAFHESWTLTTNPSREVYSGRAPPPPSNYYYDNDNDNDNNGNNDDDNIRIMIIIMIMISIMI